MARNGGMIREVIFSINAAIVWVPLGNLWSLATEDAVQWIEPPLPPLDIINDSNRIITQTDQVNSAPYGLDGSGAHVLVYDGGSALQTHLDFGGRLTVRDSTSLHYHPTHVSGTIGGDGALRPRGSRPARGRGRQLWLLGILISRFRIFPVGPVGSASVIQTVRGYL